MNWEDISTKWMIWCIHAWCDLPQRGELQDGFDMFTMGGEIAGVLEPPLAGFHL